MEHYEHPGLVRKKLNQSIHPDTDNRQNTHNKCHIIKTARSQISNTVFIKLYSGKNHNKKHNRTHNSPEEDHQYRKIDEEIHQGPGAGDDPCQPSHCFFSLHFISKIYPAQLSKNIRKKSCPCCKRCKYTGE